MVEAGHVLDPTGVIGRRNGLACSPVALCGNLVAQTTDFDGIGLPAPKCFHGKSALVEVVIADNFRVAISSSSGDQDPKHGVGAWR